MSRLVPVFVSASLALPSTAQSSVGAALVANTPIVVTHTDPSGTTTAAQPAGSLLQPGSVALPAAQIQVDWTPPTTNDPSCRFDYSSWPVDFTLTDVNLDCTLWLWGPGVHGHVQIDMTNAGDFPGHLRVDVYDDGVVEADTLSLPYFWSFAANLHVPVVLGATCVPIRIRMHGATVAPEWRSIAVRFVPWGTATADLGSSCSPNLVGQINHQDVHDYYLAALPGTGGDVLRLEADGYGTVHTFVVALTQARLPVGTIGLGLGCDDLLAAPVLDGPGIDLGNGRWALSVPPLPAGLNVHFQNASMGTWGGQIRFGLTNVVRYQT